MNFEETPPVRAGFFILLGIAPWFFTGRLLRRETLRMKEVERFDRWVLPGLLKLERLCEPPIGLSLLAVARKPAG